VTYTVKDTVKEIFLTAQGKGANIGRTTVFLHFAGCNLWSGREEDRAGGLSPMERLAIQAHKTWGIP
jgi:hypothetical protein